MSATLRDCPRLFPDTLSATLVETPGAQHNLTVIGEAAGDYRVQAVQLVRAQRQSSAEMLVLDVAAKLGPVENPHPDLERVWPLRYAEEPARHRYAKVKIVNGSQRYTVDVVAAL